MHEHFKKKKKKNEKERNTKNIARMCYALTDSIL